MPWLNPWIRCAFLTLLVTAGCSPEMTDALGVAEEAALPPTTLIARGSAWRYHDRGENLGTSWREPGTSAADWPSGRAPLGYGSAMTVATTVSYGSDARNKHVTTYFRRGFEVPLAATVKSAAMAVRLDDGAV